MRYRQQRLRRLLLLRSVAGLLAVRCRLCMVRLRGSHVAPGAAVALGHHWAGEVPRRMLPLVAPAASGSVGVLPFEVGIVGGGGGNAEACLVPGGLRCIGPLLCGCVC
ncbi:hypothetical protein Agub_g7388 [Astrephomene gubernaculifera]|uniref:Uncharacterized protein n=1 Tax=Astrephomene gubernaculifera TaxID=47775 RepID=A0AAD3DQD6_9CHLO|nr:hypothetical protein Agub_g7388 [Astrephomene gubernaculifera]